MDSLNKVVNMWAGRLGLGGPHQASGKGKKKEKNLEMQISVNAYFLETPEIIKDMEGGQ